MATIYISKHFPKVDVCIATGSHVTFLASAEVDHGDNRYSVVMRDGTFFVYVPHRGFPRKVKNGGPTYRAVMARALFPQAAA